MKIMLIFPGQGPQQVGMLHQLPATAACRELLEAAAEALGEDILALDSASALATTRAVQLCLLIAGVVHARELRAHGVVADMVAGLSIGAYPAAVVCGALDFGDAVRLVARRGALMQQAYPSGYGLTAIGGLFQREVEAIIAVLRARHEIIYLANINAEQQMVVAGTEAALAAALAMACARGGHGRRLVVSVPSHCDLLLAAAAKLREAFAKVKLARPQCAYLSANSARVLWQPQAIAEDLAGNMACQVRWHEAAVSAYQRGVRLMIEVPPGSVLTKLVRPLMNEGGEAMAMAQTPLTTLQVLAERTRRMR